HSPRAGGAVVPLFLTRSSSAQSQTVSEERMKRHNAPVCLVVVAALGGLLCGCAQSRQTQLEKVAKDWCMVIRASQVIPVYPLSEDILPGDVYLVTTTADAQHNEYKKKGFLALDNMIARLNPNGFKDYYSRSIGSA